jgi:hypothetical protein
VTKYRHVRAFSNFFKSGIMMQKKLARLDKNANNKKSYTVISDRTNQEYCIVSVSAIKDLFSTNITSTLQSPPLLSVRDKNEISYSKTGKIVSRQLRQRKTAEKSTESLQSRTARVNKTVRRERHDCGNDELKNFNARRPKTFHYQYQHILSDNSFSPIGLLPRHTSERNRLSRDEFILIQRASDQVKARVRYFDKILKDYLSQIGQDKKESPHQSVVIKMLSTTKEKFDGMIRKQQNKDYFKWKQNLMQGLHQNRVRKIYAKSTRQPLQTWTKRINTLPRKIAPNPLTNSSL